jgi:hypothetical protein
MGIYKRTGKNYKLSKMSNSYLLLQEMSAGIRKLDNHAEM